MFATFMLLTVLCLFQARAVQAVANLKLRQNSALDYCGYDSYGIDYWCSNSLCCSGPEVFWQCIPDGAECCATGYYCPPGYSCYLDTVTGDQYCECTSTSCSGSIPVYTASSAVASATTSPTKSSGSGTAPASTSAAAANTPAATNAAVGATPTTTTQSQGKNAANALFVEAYTMLTLVAGIIIAAF